MITSPPSPMSCMSVDMSTCFLFLLGFPLRILLDICVCVNTSAWLLCSVDFARHVWVVTTCLLVVCYQASRQGFWSPGCAFVSTFPLGCFTWLFLLGCFTWLLSVDFAEHVMDLCWCVCLLFLLNFALMSQNKLTCRWERRSSVNLFNVILACSSSFSFATAMVTLLKYK